MSAPWLLLEWTRAEEGVAQRLGRKVGAGLEVLQALDDVAAEEPEAGAQEAAGAGKKRARGACGAGGAGSKRARNDALTLAQARCELAQHLRRLVGVARRKLDSDLETAGRLLKTDIVRAPVARRTRSKQRQPGAPPEDGALGDFEAMLPQGFDPAQVAEEVARLQQLLGDPKAPVV
jgi:hypothetical protein